MFGRSCLLNELELFPEKQSVDTSSTKTKNWYTIEELASLCGIAVETLKKGNSPLSKLSIDFKVESRLGGYHNTQRFYSENVLKALKQYQLKNSAPNSLKNKETAITGNVSLVANEVRSQTIAAILNNPQALLELAMQSSKKLLEVSEENKALKETNNLLMHTKKTYTVSEIAKELGISSAKKLNLILEEKGIQYKRNGTWLPTAKYSESGYYEIKQEILDNGTVVYNSHITQKGRDFILNFVKAV